MRLANQVVRGLTLVVLGLIFLGLTLGYLPWPMTRTIAALFSLWPVLLVTAGLDIIGRGLATSWLRLASNVILLGAILYGGLILPATDTSASLFPIPGFGAQASNPYSFTKARGGVDEATIDIKGGAGEITLDEGRPAVLASMSGETPFENPALSVSKSSGRANVLASMGSGNVSWPLGGRSTMDIRLSPVVVWDVRFQTGASTLVANLEHIAVSGFVLKTGASDSRVTLGRIGPGRGEVPVRIESGVSSVMLRIPEGVEARVEAQTGLATVSVPSDLEHVSGDGRNYESPGYAKAGRRYRIRVQTGIGAVTIERY